MLFGYVDLSDARLEYAGQIEALKEYGAGAEGFRIETRPGRAVRDGTLALLREGDTIAAESVARAADGLEDLLSFMLAVQAKGARFVSLEEGIDTASPDGRFLLSALGAVAKLPPKPAREAEGSFPP